MEILFNESAEININGKLMFEKNLLDVASKFLAKPETRNVRIIMIQDYNNATIKQLAYYHGFLLKDVIRAFESIGQNITEIEADKTMRELFLYQYETTINTGRKRKIVRSLDKSSDSFPNTKEISVFFENIVRYCSENMNFIVNLPDDFKDIDLNFNRK